MAIEINDIPCESGAYGRKAPEFILKLNNCDGILTVDARGTIIAVNTAFCNTTGYCPEELIGKNPLLMEKKLIDRMFYKMLLRYLENADSWQGEIWVPHKNGELHKKWVQIYSLVQGDDNSTKYIIVFKDIIGQWDVKMPANYVGQYDALTGLPNRLLFDEKMKQVLEYQKGCLAAVLFLDLDRLRIINDSLGYDLGDLLLQAVARRLVETVGQKGFVARLGGDEFLIVLDELRGTVDAVRVARKILDAMSKAFVLGKNELFVGISIGISMFPHDGKETKTLIKNAETAMERAKKQGRNRYQIYFPTMNSMAMERLKLGNDLRKALSRGELNIVYQPQIELETGKVIGVEALLRWHHHKMGVVPPNRFIPIAEETGLIIPIGEWVLKTACEQNMAWQRQGLPPISVAVNISACQFRQRTLAQYITSVLRETGLDPKYLELEITETVTLQDVSYTLETLKKLKELNISISLDDFGTGCSSLTYLKQYPIDKLKIDKSFIHDINGRDEDRTIVKAIIAMAQGLNLKVVAEGVSNSSQLEFLRANRCHGAQGYLFSKPVPPEEISYMLIAGGIVQYC